MQRCDKSGKIKKRARVRPQKFTSRSHFEFAYLYELICNAKSSQRFKATLWRDWLLVFGHLTHSLFTILNIYLFTWENNFLLASIHQFADCFWWCCVCLLRRFVCLWRSCDWKEDKQLKGRGQIKVKPQCTWNYIIKIRIKLCCPKKNTGSLI